MNRPDQALDLLEACASKMSPEWIDWVKQDSDLISLHDHPRQNLISREAKLAALRKGEAAETSDAPVPQKWRSGVSRHSADPRMAYCFPFNRESRSLTTLRTVSRVFASALNAVRRSCNAC